MKLRIGTRGSALARAQADAVANMLRTAGHETTTILIETKGDQVVDRPYADIGAFGVFVREVEQELLTGNIDVAVHSYKDMPSRGPDGLVIAAVPERVDAADILLVRTDAYVKERGEFPLAPGARVGTSSARRKALLQERRSDLAVSLLRGNVPTRVRALADGRFDAIILAHAGLLRLERAAAPNQFSVPDGIVRERLDPMWFVPAPAQGAIAVQVRSDALDVRNAVAAIDDPRTARALRAERAALALADGGCTLPFGAWCRTDGAAGLQLFAMLGRDDGTVARASASGDEPDALAAVAWRELAGALPAVR